MFRLRSFISSINIRYYFLLVLVMKMVLTYKNFSLLNPDICSQLNSLYNFMHGKGCSLGEFQHYAIVYQPYNFNACGLVFFLAPLNLLFHNSLASVFALEIIAIFFFVFFLYKYMALLKIEVQLQKIILVFFAIIQSPFVYHWPADALSMILCLWGFYFTTRNLYSGKIYDTILGLLFIGLSYLVKYSFLPYLFFPFAMSLFSIRKFSANSLRKLGKIMGLTAMVGVLMFLINYLAVGQRLSDVKSTGHIYWAHLLQTDGFLFHLGDYEARINKLFHRTHVFFYISQFVTLIVGLFLLIRMLLRNKQSLLKFDQLLPVAATISLSLILGFLALLSLINPSIYFGPYTEGHGWTYVIETRYYSPAIILAYIFIITYSFYYINRTGFIVVFGFVLLLNILAFRSVVSFGADGNDFVSCLKTEADLKSNPSLSDTAKIPVVLCSSDDIFSKPYMDLHSLGDVYLVDSTGFKPSINAAHAGDFIFLTLHTDSTGNASLVKYQ